MAEKLGVPVAAFASTIADFNRACGEGTTTRPGSTAGHQRARTSEVELGTSCREGTLSCVSGDRRHVFTYGGLRTNERAEVLDRDGRVIAGLYAAGEMTGLYYTNYTGSTSVLRGAVFGKIGGALAAQAAVPANAMAQ